MLKEQAKHKERLRICRRILTDDRAIASAALVELASWYNAAGLERFALTVLSWTLSAARAHARIVVSAERGQG